MPRRVHVWAEASPTLIPRTIGPLLLAALPAGATGAAAHGPGPASVHPEGDAEGTYLAVTLEGEAESSSGVAVSGDGDAEAGLLAASLDGNADAPLAVSVSGNATGGVLAVAVGGEAACEEMSVKHEPPCVAV